MPRTEAQKRARAKYEGSSVKAVLVRFYPADADLYDWLCEQPAKATYIKGLIRADMERRRREA